MTKSEIRAIYLQQRSLLSPAAVEELSRAIRSNFQRTISLDGIRHLHLFYPIAGKKEVNTLLIAEWLRAKKKEVNLVLSKSDQRNHSLSHVLWENDTRLAMNSWGITEPENGHDVPVQELDLVLVPLLAYDDRGHRVGYGKGFYDHFLTQCRPDALKVGLSFFEPDDDPIETSETDIALDCCITPFGIYNF